MTRDEYIALKNAWFAVDASWRGGSMDRVDAQVDKLRAVIADMGPDVRAKVGEAFVGPSGSLCSVEIIFDGKAAISISCKDGSGIDPVPVARYLARVADDVFPALMEKLTAINGLEGKDDDERIEIARGVVSSTISFARTAIDATTVDLGGDVPDYLTN